MTGYTFEHEGQQFDPNGRVNVADVAAHDAALEQAELAYWQTKPDRFIAYIIKNKDGEYVPTTWRSTPIGRIVARTRFRNNLTGSRMEYVRIAGNNGATYYGTYGCDWSQGVRLRKAK